MVRYLYSNKQISNVFYKGHNQEIKTELVIVRQNLFYKIAPNNNYDEITNQLTLFC
jgi:hypothetical protein